MARIGANGLPLVEPVKPAKKNNKLIENPDVQSFPVKEDGDSLVAEQPTQQQPVNNLNNDLVQGNVSENNK